MDSAKCNVSHMALHMDKNDLKIVLTPQLCERSCAPVRSGGLLTQTRYSDRNFFCGRSTWYCAWDNHFVLKWYDNFSEMEMVELIATIWPCLCLTMFISASAEFAGHNIALECVPAYVAKKDTKWRSITPPFTYTLNHDIYFVPLGICQSIPCKRNEPSFPHWHLEPYGLDQAWRRSTGQLNNFFHQTDTRKN